MGCGCCGNKPEEPLHVPRKRPISYRSITPTERQETPTVDRFYKISIWNKNPHKFIDGYLDEPIVSLEEALQPFHGEINDLAYYIRDAKTKCHHPSEHGLTLDESAAIYIYSMRWKDRCVYDQLQAAWGSDDKAQMKPWFRYLKLFRSALDKLPTIQSEAWQGIPYDEKFEEALASNLALYTSMGSGSPSSDVIQEHLGKHEGKRMILIGYKNINGKSVTGYTAESQKEILIWPGMKLGTTKSTEYSENGSIIHHFSAVAETPRVLTAVSLISQQPHFVCQNKRY